MSTLVLPDPKLLDLLVCPLTKAQLVFNPDKTELISASASLAFPIRDGLPIMLVDEARPLNETERAQFKASAKS